MNVKRRSANRCATLSGEPVRKLSMQMTSSPSPRNRSQRCEPMNPAPPLIRTRATAAFQSSRLGTDGCPTDRDVREAVLPHDVRLVEVAAVEDDRPAKHALHAREVR